MYADATIIVVNPEVSSIRDADKAIGIVDAKSEKAKENKKVHTILGGTILGSILFFIITNFTVWSFGTMYVNNISGLLQCYYMAIPFFRNSLVGDIFYVGVLVGSMELVLYLVTKSKIIKWLNG